VVGSGASGAQIAEELVRAGRKVYLSVGRHKRMPRRYRGHDLIWWLATMGLDQTPVAERGPDATLPLITGAYGGHTVDFREFAAQGMILVGRLQSMRDGVLCFADDLAGTFHPNLERVRNIRIRPVLRSPCVSSTKIPSTSAP
jgi:putative flavoprotein involved in K+ transport